MKINEKLFKTIIDTAQDCVFWKDKDRRFVGVNKAFLDFYGFESDEILIGKNDEEMGWHSDPEPYKRDELEVLEGKNTYKVRGKCIIRGEERDIIASKRPIYDGDKIIGLSGSFVDITDVVKRANRLEGSQVMYTMDKLRRFPFFDKIIDETGLDELLDPLTGILSRAWAIRFVQSLIEEKTPFTFSIIDLDNFKSINDSYGHSAGDKVLARVAKGLADISDGFGLAGRFGGDELLFIDLKNISFNDKKKFYNDLYEGSFALRINERFEGGEALITGTSGCASFPEDADNFNELFGIIDKMLYLGKNKGRNCYTIYDESRHKDIEIRKLNKDGLFSVMHEIREITEKEKSVEDKLSSVFPILKEMIQIKELLYVNKEGLMCGTKDKTICENAKDIEKIVKGDIYNENTLEPIKKHSPVFYRSLIKNGFESVMVVRVKKGNETIGYIVCAVRRSLRIWQDSECALVYYVSGLISQ
ncbi:MAG: GGDEF domain-containing protein [Lachnospiraceae bacterium]|nr:GGDEF domain-containing protein [Lachnospiraceae bacterium]